MKLSTAVGMLLILALASSACGGTTRVENVAEAEQHHNVGVGLALKEQWNEAIAEFDEALGLDPNYAVAYINRSAAYFALGQYERAIRDLDEAIRLNAKDDIAYANRALAYTALSKDQEAKRDAARAVELGYDPTRLKRNIEELKKRR